MIEMSTLLDGVIARASERPLFGYAIFAFDDMYSHVGSIALIVSPFKALMKDQVSLLVATLMVI